MALRIELISDIKRFKELAPEWNELVSRMDHPQVFYRWEWNWLSYQHLQQKGSIFIISVHDGDDLVAIAPLFASTRRVLGVQMRVLQTIVSGVADYQNLLIEAGGNRRLIVKAILGWLCEQRSQWDVIDLQDFSSRDSTTIHVAMLTSEFTDLRCNMVPAARTPFVDYRRYPAKIDTKRVKRIRTRRRNLLDKGYVLHIGQPMTEEFWNEFCDLHDRRWGGMYMREGPSFAFYNALNQALGPQNALECSSLKFAGRSAAMHFGFRDDHKVYYYMPAMDPAQREQRVGAVLADAMVEHYAKTHREFDFLRGDESYKYLWTDEVGVNFRLILFHRDNVPAVLYNLVPALRAFIGSIALPGLVASRLRARLGRSSSKE